MIRRAAILLGLLLAGPAMAEGWAGFYISTAPARKAAPIARVALDRTDVCIDQILKAQARHGIPDNLLLAIGLQEAGRRHKGRTTVWPFAVNAAGEGRMFETKDAAQDWVRDRQAAGVRSIDVGCMQINLRWHPKAFGSLDDGFDPARNVDYAARFLKRLRTETGSWRGAAGAYHSRDPVYRSAYLNRLDGNISRANAQHDAFARRIAQGPRDAAPVSPVAPEPRIARIAAGWGSALAGGTRGTIYSRDAIRPLMTGGAR